MKPIDPEKLRTMVRSILPSRYRTGPRSFKAIVKRAHRRGVRLDVRVEDHEETAADFLRDVSVAWIVSWRRGGDKLNHFMRWCEAITEGMSTEEALGYVRSILPKSLIGEHAYGHWEAHRGDRFGTFVERTKPAARRQQSYHDSATFRLRRALRADPELHGRLNAEIKARKMFDQPRRLLLGMHDVEAFVDDADAIERQAMFRLIEEVEKGGLTAALRVSGPFDFAQSRLGGGSPLRAIRSITSAKRSISSNVV